MLYSIYFLITGFLVNKQYFETLFSVMQGTIIILLILFTIILQGTFYYFTTTDNSVTNIFFFPSTGDWT